MPDSPIVGKENIAKESTTPLDDTTQSGVENVVQDDNTIVTPKKSSGYTREQMNADLGSISTRDYSNLNLYNKKGYKEERYDAANADYLKLYYPSLSNQIDDARANGHSNSAIMAYLSDLEAAAQFADGHSVKDIDQFLGRTPESKQKIRRMIDANQLTLYKRLYGDSMSQKQIAELVDVAAYTGTSPHILVAYPKIYEAKKIEAGEKATFAQYVVGSFVKMYRGWERGRELKKATQLSDLYQNIKNIEQEEARGEGSQVQLGRGNNPPGMSVDRAQKLMAKARRDHAELIENMKKYDAKDIASYNYRMPNSVIGAFLYEVAQSSGFTVSSAAFMTMMNMLGTIGGGLIGGAFGGGATFGAGAIPGGVAGAAIGRSLMVAIGSLLNTDAEAKIEAGEILMEHLRENIENGMEDFESFEKALADTRRVVQNVWRDNLLVLAGPQLATDMFMFGITPGIDSSGISKAIKGRLFGRHAKPNFIQTVYSNATSKVIARYDLLPAPLKVATKAMVSMVEEGFEEGAQNYIQAYERGEDVDWNELGHAATIGAGSGAIYALIGLGGQRVAGAMGRKIRGSSIDSTELKSVADGLADGTIKPGDVIKDGDVVFISRTKFDEVLSTLSDDAAVAISNLFSAADQVAEYTDADGNIMLDEYVLTMNEFNTLSSDYADVAEALKGDIRQGIKGITANEIIRDGTAYLKTAYQETLYSGTERANKALAATSDFMQGLRNNTEYEENLIELAGTFYGNMLLAGSDMYGVSIEEMDRIKIGEGKSGTANISTNIIGVLSGGIKPTSKSTIQIFSSSDGSAIFHELWHFGLNNLIQFGLMDSANEQTKRDRQAVLEWLNISDLDFTNYSFLSDRKSEAYHRYAAAQEIWAESGENYLATGKAPNGGLQKLFDNIRTLFLKSLDVIAGNKNEYGDLNVSDSIVEVYERMLAIPVTDADISVQSLSTIEAAINVLQNMIKDNMVVFEESEQNITELVEPNIIQRLYKKKTDAKTTESNKELEAAQKKIRELSAQNKTDKQEGEFATKAATKFGESTTKQALDAGKDAVAQERSEKRALGIKLRGEIVELRKDINDLRSKKSDIEKKLKQEKNKNRSELRELQMETDASLMAKQERLNASIAKRKELYTDLIETREAFREFRRRSTIDMRLLRAKKNQIIYNLRRLNAAKNRVRRQIEAIRAAAKNKSIHVESSIEINELIAGVNLKKLSVMHLEQVYEEVMKEKEIGSEKLRELQAIKQMRRYENRMEVVTRLKKIAKKRSGVITDKDMTKKDYSGIRGKFARMKDWAASSQLGIVRLANWVDGGTDGIFMKLFYYDINLAADNELRNSQRRIEGLHELMKALDVSTTSLAEKIKVEGVLVDRPGGAWTLNELGAVYALSRNERGKEALIYGTFARYPDGEQALDAVLAALSNHKKGNAIKQMAEYMMKDYNVNFDRINNTLVDEYNISMHKEENYFPISRIGVSRDINNRGLFGGSTSTGAVGTVSKGFAESRIVFGDKEQGDVVLNLYGSYISQVQTQEHTAAYARVTNDINALLGGRPTPLEIKMNILRRNDTVKNLVTRVYGEGAYNALRRYAEIFTRDETSIAHDVMENVTDKLAKNMSVSYICGNVSTMIAQLTSITRYFISTDPIYLFGAIGECMFNYKNFMETVYKLDPQIKNRGGGLYLKMIKSDPTWGSSTYQKALEIGFSPISSIDRIVAAIGWKATYNNCLARGMSKEASRVEAQKITIMTQQATMSKDAPLLWHSTGIARLAMIFTSEAASLLGMSTYDLANSIHRKDIQQFLRGIVSLAIGGMLWKMLKDGLPDEDNDESWGAWCRDAFVEQSIESMPIIGKELVSKYKQMMGGRSYYGGSNSLAAPILKVIAGASGISKNIIDDVPMSEWDEKDLWSLGEGISLLGGKHPVIALKRATEAIRSLPEEDAINTIRIMIGNAKADKSFMNR